RLVQSATTAATTGPPELGRGRDNGDNRQAADWHGLTRTTETTGHPLGTPVEFGEDFAETHQGEPEKAPSREGPISPPQKRPAWVTRAQEIGEPFPATLFAGIYGHAEEAAMRRINGDWLISLESQDAESFEVVLMEEEMLIAHLCKEADE